MLSPVSSEHQIAGGQIIDISALPTASSTPLSGKELKAELKATVKQISKLQEVLHAQGKFAVLLIFQAMDAAGKDSTIRAVMSGINPAGCSVQSFKRPSHKELKHDYLWRTTRVLPERGQIGVFNRSYYEEVLVSKVHPEFLQGQSLDIESPDTFWQSRYESIINHEKHLTQNETLILKFWLNISQREQHQRFLSRLNTPEKNWKFEASDISESKLWPGYMQAYADMLQHTSTPWAPWHAIPADSKPFMRLEVAKIILANLQALPLAYPEVTEQQRQDLQSFKRQLEQEMANTQGN